MTTKANAIDRSRIQADLLQDPQSLSLRCAIVCQQEGAPKPLAKALKSGATYYAIVRTAFLAVAGMTGISFLSSAQIAIWKQPEFPALGTSALDFILVPGPRRELANSEVASSRRLTVDKTETSISAETQQQSSAESTETEEPPPPADQSGPRPTPPVPLNVQ